MNIRAKLISIVLPLLVLALVIGGLLSSSIATRAVSGVAIDFLNFKTDQLEQYIDGQWRILLENDLTGRQDMVRAAQAGIEVFAQGIIRSESELIFALDGNGNVVMATEDFALPEGDADGLLEAAARPEGSLETVTVDGRERVATSFTFEPFGWTVFATELRDTFYSEVDRITLQTLYLILGGSLAAVVLVIFFVGYITSPVKRLVRSMRDVISTNDLSQRVPVAFRDEIGEMSQTFNVMLGELEQAYDRIKKYAFQAVVSQKKEQKIRNIFQKYVPQELIDRFFENPESMLVGENRELSVLFSDIRGFTSISEGMQPDDLVTALNRYFSIMVDIIMNRNGIIDKYIGDAIMAFFGAPVHHEDDPLQSVLTGIDMVDGMHRFNEDQRRRGEPEFAIGIGINLGVVTVGNIGTERKMDYTVIGDMVNVASRLEGLTKMYQQPLIISEYLQQRIDGELPTRILDSVAVKGRKAGLRIYTAARELTEEQERAWGIHNEAMERYYRREFADAAAAFREVRAILPEDYPSTVMEERCERMAQDPPPEDWSGVETMKSK